MRNARCVLPAFAPKGEAMSNAVEVVLIIIGLVALLWAIMNPNNAGIVPRVIAGMLGILLVAIAVIFHRDDDRGCR